MKKFRCALCPYISNDRNQFDYHRQTQHASQTAFKCSICSFSVSKRHLFYQHLRIHGIEVPQSSNVSGIDNILNSPADISGQDTSHCKEIPLVWVSRQGSISKMYKCRYCPHVNMRKSNIQEHEKMHSVRTPKTLADGTAAPPLQQHYCPDCNYVCNNAGVLSSHAKVHQGMFGTVCAMYDSSRSDEEQIESVMVLLNSTKFKRDDEPAITVINVGDNETIETTPDIGALLNQDDKEDNIPEQAEESSLMFSAFREHVDPTDFNPKVLHFCSQCPARFLYEKELLIHSRFHSLQLTHSCSSCSYAARQEAHLLAHYKVHTDEYQERTKSLLTIYGQSSKYPRKRTAVLMQNPNMSEYIWVVVSDVSQGMAPTPFSLNFNIKNTMVGQDKKKDKIRKTPQRVITKQFSCTKCPAMFFKSVALQYHLTLHGGSGPHKCRSCDYAVKTYGNLIKHEQVHDTLQPRVKCKIGKPATAPPPRKQDNSNIQTLYAKPEYHLKNIDPEFGFLMLGNPNFNYQTYIKNGKVKSKRYKCHKCPSAFEKREQYKVHLSLHGAQQKYRCDKCDYSVKYYANYIQHIRKHEKSESFDIPATEAEVTIEPQPSMKQMLLNFAPSLQEQFHLCNFCPYASSKPDALKNHIKRHHGQGQSMSYDANGFISSNNESLRTQDKSEDTDSAYNIPEPICELLVKTEEEEEVKGEASFCEENDIDDDYDEEVEKRMVMMSQNAVGDIERDDEDHTDQLEVDVTLEEQPADSEEES